MPWDDELEQLTNRTHDTLGEDVFHAALSRAFAIAVTQHSQPIETAAIDGPGTIISTAGTVTSIDAFYDALRTELRQVLREH